MARTRSCGLLLCLIGLSLLACCGAKDFTLVEKSYGDKGMPKRILIVYGTWAGSTADVAEFIGKTLAEGGYRVDVKPVESVTSTAGYHAVIIGSAIRMGRVMPEILDFVKSRKAELGKIPTAYFVVCMTMKDDTPGNRRIVDAYLDPLRREASPMDAGLFAGRMEYARLGFLARTAVEHFVKVPEGDFRNWDIIRDWAQGLLQKLDG